MLELIIERGMHYLQTMQGEKLPRVVQTVVSQFKAEPGECQFTMYVDEPFGCQYDQRKKRIVTPGGVPLARVEVLKYKPGDGKLIPAMVLCKCRVALQYDTNHKPHFVNTLAN